MTELPHRKLVKYKGNFLTSATYNVLKEDSYNFFMLSFFNHHYHLDFREK